jgi:DNA polymerase V
MQIGIMDSLSVNKGKPVGEAAINQVNMDDLFLERPGKLYAMVVNSEMVSQAGIDKGDQVIVDRERLPSNGNIVIARIGQDMCIRQLLIEDGRKTLVSPGKSLSPLAVDPSFICWGVVIYVLKKML